MKGWTCRMPWTENWGCCITFRSKCTNPHPIYMHNVFKKENGFSRKNLQTKSQNFCQKPHPFNLIDHINKPFFDTCKRLVLHQMAGFKLARVKLSCCQDDSSFNNRLSGCFVLWQYAKPFAIWPLKRPAYYVHPKYHYRVCSW